MIVLAWIRSQVFQPGIRVHYSTNGNLEIQCHIASRGNVLQRALLEKKLPGLESPVTLEMKVCGVVVK